MDKLSILQKKALCFILKKQNVLITGSAGTGKSLLINVIKKIINKKYPDINLYITASTGVAAINIKGCTLHSFAGIGLGKSSKEELLKKIKYRKQICDRWKDVDILIIDEISMISCDIFEKIEYIARQIRNSILPFGGIQLILVGDFFQLTPIIDIKREDNKVFCFESEIWDKCNLNIINLKKIYRQDDLNFQLLLNRLRIGTYTNNDILEIKNRIKKPPLNNSYIHLYPTNKQVKNENMKMLNKINNYNMIYEPNYIGDDELKKELKLQFKQINMDKIYLKIGARIMLVTNLDTTIGLCNGTLGTIKDFNDDGLPIVLFDNNIQMTINRHTWELEKKIRIKSLNCKNNNISGINNFKKIKASAIQIPLILAWSISIHRSQGLTFENAIISLDKCFAEHHIYVALSRVKSLNGIYIEGDIIENKIKINNKVKKFFNKK
jgi:ATP-dependent DNA helicase PIF1